MNPTVRLSLVLGFAASTLIAAEEPLARLGGDPYLVRNWTMRDGLPGHHINDITQDRDGYLWLGTNGGLVRFDGHEFEVLHEGNSAMPSSRVLSVHAATSGVLWAGTQQGHVLRIVDEEITEIGRLDGRNVEDLAETGDGTLWVAARIRLDALDEPALWRFRGERLEPQPQLNATWCVRDGSGAPMLRRHDGTLTAPHPFSSELTFVLFVDAAGDAWAKLKSGGTARLRDGRFEPYGPSIVESPPTMFLPRRPLLHARVDGERVEVYDENGRPVGEFHGDPERAVALLVDRHGALWIRRDETRVEVYPPVSAEASYRYDFETPIHSVLEDAEGNIWLATASRGLFRLSPNPFRFLGPEQGFPVAKELHRLGDGRIAPGRVGTGCEVYVVSGDEARPLPDTCRIVVDDRRGTRWTQAPPAAALRGRRPGAPDLWIDVKAQHATEDPARDGTLWVSLGGRLQHVDPYDAAGTRVLGSYDFAGARPTWDRSGVLWSGGTRGLFRVENGETRHFTTADGLPVNQVRGRYEDETGALWIATYGGGLVRHRNRTFEAIDVRHGLGDAFLTALLEDDAGNFWISGNKGIHRVARRQLEEVLDGSRERVEAVTYAWQVGMPNPEAMGAYPLEDPQRRMWFATLGGMVVFDPARVIALESTPPRVHVVAVVHDQQRRPATGGLTVGPSSRRFAIDYTAISLRDPAGLRYRYRLDGFDRDWIDAADDRRAIYSSVPPGRYTFRVQALSAGGVWSAADATLDLRMRPFFYETASFYGLCGVLLVGMLSVGYRRRTRRLSQRAAELEEIVRRRTRELRQQKRTVERQADQLQDLDRAKSRFFANISHEFRTPLTLIQGPLEDLRDGMHGPQSEQAIRQMELATQNSRRLLRLVDQLLDIARAESGRIEIQARRSDFCEFTRRIAGGFHPLAERKRIEFVVDVPSGEIPLWFDADQIEKVLTNLLGNAFKFTPEGGNVRLEVRQSGSDDDGNVVIAVRDDGPGIPESDLPRIFDRFHQVDGSSTRAQPGTGIGLALAKELTELHRGTITVESRAGAGSVFTVTLRLGQAHFTDGQLAPAETDDFEDRVAAELGAEPPPLVLDDLQPTAPAPADRVTGEDVTSVLVVDDSPGIRSYLRRHLASRYRVLEADNGTAGLEMTRQLLPDLVVSDVMMPGLDGFDLCREVKSDPATDFIPVILLTAKASSESRIGGLEKGADDYLTKPFNVRELEARVDNLIASRRRLKERFSTTGSNGARPGSPVAITPAAVQLESADQALLERVRDAIESRMADEDFSVEELAREVGQSRVTLYRKLRDLLQVSPSELIRTIRLEHAARLLAAKAGSVSEIAYAVGFRSVAHFSNRFKERFEVSPSAYRVDP